MKDYIGAVVEKIFEYKGYKCVVLMQGLAFRTGYVAVPEGNEYYNVEYMKIPIECHGGLTYSRSYLIHTDDKNVWWIGFDTGHYGDGNDYQSALELFKDYPKNIENIKRNCELGLYYLECPARSLDYCMNECKKIVDQLIEVSK